VFEAYKADFRWTFILGNNPIKLRLQGTLEPIQLAVKV
jgi:hypothetical protein